MDVILDAPTNLGLRPPAFGSVPGADKAPAALRDALLHETLRGRGWHEAGVVLAGRYQAGLEPGRIRNQAAILDHASRLAARIGDQLDQGNHPLVLGGDCSTLLGCALAVRRRGRYGLIHIDGHTDFRHPGNSAEVASLAGEDLAAAVGLHYPEISDIDNLGPYIDPRNALHVGCRADDEDLGECRDVLGAVITADEWTREPARVLAVADELASRPHVRGFWLHVDVDVLDPEYLPAVDSPDPGGVSPDQLGELLADLWPRSVGMTVGILDPDLDPDGRYARLVADLILRAVSP